MKQKRDSFLAEFPHDAISLTKRWKNTAVVSDPKEGDVVDWCTTKQTPGKGVNNKGWGRARVSGDGNQVSGGHQKCSFAKEN